MTKIEALNNQIYQLGLKIESLEKFHQYHTVGILELDPAWPGSPGGSEVCNALLIDRSDMCIKLHDWIDCY